MSKEKVSARAWIIVSIVWIGYVVVNLANFSIGIMMPDIQAELADPRGLYARRALDGGRRFRGAPLVIRCLPPLTR